MYSCYTMFPPSKLLPDIKYNTYSTFILNTAWCKSFLEMWHQMKSRVKQALVRIPSPVNTCCCHWGDSAVTFCCTVFSCFWTVWLRLCNFIPEEGGGTTIEVTVTQLTFSWFSSHCLLKTNNLLCSVSAVDSRMYFHLLCPDLFVQHVIQNAAYIAAFLLCFSVLKSYFELVHFWYS